MQRAPNTLRFHLLNLLQGHVSLCVEVMTSNPSFLQITPRTFPHAQANFSAAGLSPNPEADLLPHPTDVTVTTALPGCETQTRSSCHDTPQAKPL